MGKVQERIEKENELGARRAVLEDLFYDFHSSRRQIYGINFLRGLFFGVGSVLGATLIVALVIWLLSWLTDIPGGIGDFIQYVIDTVKNSN